MKARRQKLKHRDDEIIKLARSDIQVVHLTCTVNHTEEKREDLNERKKALEEIYNKIFGEELNHKIMLIEQANRTNKDQENWKIINEIA